VALIVFLPNEVGEVAPSYGVGGVIGIGLGAHDPSVGVQRRHLPKLRLGRKSMSARVAVNAT